MTEKYIPAFAGMTKMNKEEKTNDYIKEVGEHGRKQYIPGAYTGSDMPPYAKYHKNRLLKVYILIIFLVIILVFLATSGYFTKKDIELNVQKQGELASITKNSALPAPDLELKFKVLQSVKSQFDGATLLLAGSYYDIASEQNLSSQGLCGGSLTFSDCYIFWDGSASNKGSQSLITVFRRSMVGAVKKDSIKFIDGHTIGFESGDGDAGWSYRAKWQLNLWTSELKQISREDFNSEL